LLPLPLPANLLAHESDRWHAQREVVCPQSSGSLAIRRKHGTGEPGTAHDGKILRRTSCSGQVAERWGGVPAARDRQLDRKAMTEQQVDKGSIQVIERMMSLLEVLADMPEPASLKLLAQSTGLHPSTAHRILAAMTSAAIVERQDAGSYMLGIRLLELGNIVKSRINIRQVALPHMQQLHELVGEAVNLGIRHEDEIIYVERTSSGRSLVRVVYLVGGRAPLHGHRCI